MGKTRNSDFTQAEMDILSPNKKVKNLSSNQNFYTKYHSLFYRNININL